MKKIAASACLCGIACRMDGQAKPNEQVMKLYRKGLVIPVCPEVDGGLPTPRDPSERKGDRVVSKHGTDVTAAFVKGAQADLQKTLENGCTVAILKTKSPSCGIDVIHNGEFDGGLVHGNGVFAQLLKEHGITCIKDTDGEKIGEILQKTKTI